MHPVSGALLQQLTRTRTATTVPCYTSGKSVAFSTFTAECSPHLCLQNMLLSQEKPVPPSLQSLATTLLSLWSCLTGHFTGTESYNLWPLEYGFSHSSPCLCPPQTLQYVSPLQSLLIPLCVYSLICLPIHRWWTSQLFLLFGCFSCCYRAFVCTFIWTLVFNSLG